MRFILAALLAALISHTALADDAACATPIDILQAAHDQGLTPVGLSKGTIGLIINDMKRGGFELGYEPTNAISVNLGNGRTKVVFFKDGCADQIVTTSTTNYYKVVGLGL